MFEHQKIIARINEACKVFFDESTFFLQPSSANRFKIAGSYSDKAINNYDGSLGEVNVIKWFDDFWIYVDIRFENAHTFISISIFQGKEYEVNKHQLFRAEWDDFGNKNETHPQPHWHITANQAIEGTFNELAKLDSATTFVSLLSEEKSKVIDLNKFHFAMIGNWIKKDSHVHAIKDEDEVVRWFQGLLSHIKVQLQYLKQ